MNIEPRAVTPVPKKARQHYLSTACVHGLSEPNTALSDVFHERCRKTCKFCLERCRCYCHGPVETT